MKNPGAIILAGGLGKRLKAVGLKPFLLCRGRSFIRIAVEKAASANLEPVIIVTNQLFYPRMLDYNFAAKICINPRPEQGMLSSLLIGLQELPHDCTGFFLCPVDFPLIEPATFHKLLLAHRSRPDCIIKPVYKNRSGHPVVFPGNLFEPLRQAPLDQGARFVTRQYAHLTKHVAVPDPGILININLPELYEHYCK